MNTTTGALRIVKNLASSTNIANDTLSYSCVATVGGTEYNLQKSIDVLIQTVGASASVVLLKLRVTPLYCHWWNDKATDAPLADVTLGTMIGWLAATVQSGDTVPDLSSTP